MFPFYPPPPENIRKLKALMFLAGIERQHLPEWVQEVNEVNSFGQIRPSASYQTKNRFRVIR